MKKILLSLFILSSLSVFGQETWNACNSTVNVIPQPSYDSTFVLSAPSRAALAKGMASWTPARSYKVYTALLTQSGTDAPVATVLENTLGGTVVWSYWSIGNYRGTLVGAFPASKTIIQYDPFAFFSGDGIMYVEKNDDIITVQTRQNLWDGTFPTSIDGYLNNTYIQILVYP